MLLCLLAPAALTAQRRGRVDVAATAGVSDHRRCIVAARDGDTVVVHAGIYREPLVTIDKRIVLVGEGAPVLDGEGKHALLLVTADDVTVRGLVLRNVGTSFVEDRAALKANHVRGCVDRSQSHRERLLRHLPRRRDRLSCRRQRHPRPSDARNRGRQRHSSLARRAGSPSRTTTSPGNATASTSSSCTTPTCGATRVRTTCATVSTSCTPTTVAYVANTFRENGSGVAVMYTKGVTMTANRFEDNWGRRRLRAAAQGDQRRAPRAQHLRSQHDRARRRRRQPHRRSRQRVHRQRLGSSPRGEHGRRPLRAKQLRRQHVRRRHEQPVAVDDFRRQLLGRLPRLRRRSRRQWAMCRTVRCACSPSSSSNDRPPSSCCGARSRRCSTPPSAFCPRSRPMRSSTPRRR